MHRSEGSGTTFIFTDYLSAVSPAWKAGPGQGKSVQWPTGIGERGNEGVPGHIKQTPGAIGYVELAYVKQNHLSAAAAPERSRDSSSNRRRHRPRRRQKQPSRSSRANSDYRVSIVNSPGAQTLSNHVVHLVSGIREDVRMRRRRRSSTTSCGGR